MHGLVAWNCVWFRIELWTGVYFDKQSVHTCSLHEDIVDEFTDKLKKHIESAYSPNMGDPLTSQAVFAMVIVLT
jgi:hypothetical protein